MVSGFERLAFRRAVNLRSAKLLDAKTCPPSRDALEDALYQHVLHVGLKVSAQRLSNYAVILPDDIAALKFRKFSIIRKSPLLWHGQGGLVVLRDGETVSETPILSPLAFAIEHRAEIEVLAADNALLDALLVAIAAAITADPMLGGAVEWAQPGSADIRNTWNGRVHIGLVDRDLRGIDRLGGRHTLARGLAPGLGVHGLALPPRMIG